MAMEMNRPIRAATEAPEAGLPGNTKAFRLEFAFPD
jgi:hypothetical protein